MATITDDFPHPIPKVSSLRWKENWLFVLIDPGSRSFGVVHLNHEPEFNRVRYSAHFAVDGEQYDYANETTFPKGFETARVLGDDNIRAELAPEDGDFRVQVSIGSLKADVAFDARFPVFDYGICRYANPDQPSFQEIMTFGSYLPYNHHQQALTSRGTITVGETRIVLNGLGYRDHSWCMRADNMIDHFSWSNFHFRDKVIAVKTISSTYRPGLKAFEGYVCDRDGARALKSFDVLLPSETDSSAHYILEDTGGTRYVVEADLAQRSAVVELSVTRHGRKVYKCDENFTSCVLDGHVEGFAHMEIGAIC